MAMESVFLRKTIGFYGDFMGFYGGLMGFNWFIPSGNLLHRELENHHAINGKTHYKIL